MADRLTNKRHVLALYQAAKDAGIDASTLTAENPFLKSGSTAGMLQAVLQENDPVLAAEMRVAAGITPSLAAMAQLMQGGDIDAAARQSLIETDPAYAAEVVKQQKVADEKIIQNMQSAADAKRQQRFVNQAGGDERRAQHLMQKDEQLQAHQMQRAQSAKIKFKSF